MATKLSLNELKDTILEILEEELDNMMENPEHMCEEEEKHCMECCEENYCEECADYGASLMEKKNKNWIKKAIEKPGSLRKTAKRKGLIKGDEKLSKTDLDKLGKTGNSKTAKRAQLAKNLGNLKEATPKTTKITKEQLEKMIREALKSQLKK